MKKISFVFIFVTTSLLMLSCSSDDGGSSNAEKVIGTWKFAGEMTGGVFVPDEMETCDDEILKMNSNLSASLNVRECGASDDLSTFSWEKLSDNTYRIYDDVSLDKTITVDYSDDYQTMTIYSATDSSPDVWEKQ